jgi:hypothetical protein
MRFFGQEKSPSLSKRIEQVAGAQEQQKQSREQYDLARASLEEIRLHQEAGNGTFDDVVRAKALVEQMNELAPRLGEPRIEDPTTLQ